MDYKEFIDQVKKDLPGRLAGDLKGASVEDGHVEKLQNASYDGIAIRPENGGMGISVSMEGYFAAVENIFGPQSCRWTGNWKRRCSTRGTVNAAAGAGRGFCHDPTGGNTAPTVRLSFIASRRPRANGGAGCSVDN